MIMMREVWPAQMKKSSHSRLTFLTTVLMLYLV